MLFTRQPSWTGIARYILEIVYISSSLHDFKKVDNAIQRTGLDTKLHVTTIVFSSGTLSFSSFTSIHFQTETLPRVGASVAGSVGASVTGPVPLKHQGTFCTV